LSKEQLGQLSNDEIYDLIEKNLSYDAYKNNEVDKVKFKNGDNLKGLEYVLFRCPHCHKEKSIISNNDTTLVCKDCGYSVKGNEYGLLESLNNSKIYFTSPSEWYFSIYDYYKNKILLGEEILLENEVDILMINYKKKKYELVGKGKVCLNKDKIILTGDVNKEFNITNYPYLPFIPGRHLDLQDGQDIYRLDFKEKYDVTKFVMLIKIYHSLIK
jgi:ribosomal protein S27E